MIHRFEVVPIDRLGAQVDMIPGWWAPNAYQGPGGCYAIQETDDDHTFQVWRVNRQNSDFEKVSEPYLTTEGAGVAARRLAEGGEW